MDFWETGIFLINQQSSSQYKNEITNAFERNRYQLNAQLWCSTGLVWSNISCLCGISLQAMSMSYLGKLTQDDLQNWCLLTRKYKCYFYSYIFTNQSLHETISHSTFCREGLRDKISLWNFRYLRFVQPTVSSYPKQSLHMLRWCNEFKLLQIGWAMVTFRMNSQVHCKFN